MIRVDINPEAGAHKAQGDLREHLTQMCWDAVTRMVCRQPPAIKLQQRHWQLLAREKTSYILTRQQKELTLGSSCDARTGINDGQPTDAGRHSQLRASQGWLDRVYWGQPRVYCLLEKDGRTWAIFDEVKTLYQFVARWNVSLGLTWQPVTSKAPA